MRILKYTVPLDDQWHEIGRGDVVLVAPADRATAFVWVAVDGRLDNIDKSQGTPRRIQQARVFGTGHEIPLGAEPLGSYVDPPFVWHVLGRTVLVEGGAS